MNMLGIDKIAPGRMGNRLFHYHFLRQVAEKTAINYFHPRLPDAKYFQEMEKRSRPFFPFRKTIGVDSSDVLSYQPEEFLSYVMEQNNKGRDIIIRPPVLGEVFFDYLFLDPNEFIRVKQKFQVPLPIDLGNSKLIGLHFRGTDFPAWNPNAALKSDYYRSAVECCFEAFPNQPLAFATFTDDHECPAFVETMRYLRSLPSVRVYVGNKDAPPIHDFYAMTQCDVLVSSPSTFAIFAGVLGKPKKIIHSSKWMDYAIQQQDAFWVHLARSTNPFYRLWRAL